MARSLGEAVLFIKVNTKQSMNGLKNFGRSLQNVGSGMTQMGNRARNAGLLAGAAIGGLLAPAIKFEKSLSAVKAISGATEEQMKDLEAQARKLGETTAFSASQAAEAQRFLAMAGLEVDQVMGSVADTLNLAIIGEMDLARAADLATNVMSGFGKEAKDLAHITNVMAVAATSTNTSVSELAEGMKVIAPFASKTKTSFEEVSAALGILANSGLKGSEAGNGLQRIMVRLTKPTKAMKKAIKDAGLAVDELNPSTNNLVTIMEKLHKANLLNAQSAEIFGLRGLKFGIALKGKEATESMKKLRDRMKETTDAAQKMADIMMDNTAGSLLLLKSAMESISIDIFKALGSTVRDSIDAFTKMVLKVGQWVKANGPLVKTLFKIVSVLVGLTIAFGTIASIIGPIILGIGTLVVAFGMLGKVLALGLLPLAAIVGAALAVVWAMGVLWNALKRNRKAIEEWADQAGAVEILKGLWRSFALAFKEIQKAVSQAVNKLVQEFNKFLQTPAMQAFIQKLVAMRAKIVPFFKGLMKWVAKTGKAFIEWATVAIPAAGKAIVKWLTPIIKRLIKLYRDLAKTIKSLPWDAIKEKVSGAVMPALKALMSFFKFFTTFVKNMILNLIDGFDGMGRGFMVAVNFFKPSFEFLYDSFRELMNVFIEAFGLTEDGTGRMKEAFEILGASVGVVLGALVSVVAQTVGFIIKGITAIIKAGQFWITEFLTGFQTLKQAWETIVTVFEVALMEIKIAFQQVIIDLRRWVTDVKNALKDMFRALVDAWIQTYNSIKNWINNILTVIGQFLKDLAKGFKEGLIGVWNGFISFWKDLFNYIKGLGVRFYNAGKNLMKSIWNGMKAVWGDFKNWWGDKWTKFKTFFDWRKKNSPSMKEIWTNSMKGLKGVARSGAQGIIKEVKGVHLTPPSVSPVARQQSSVLNDQRQLNMNVNTNLDIQEVQRHMTNHFNTKRSLAGNV